MALGRDSLGQTRPDGELSLASATSAVCRGVHKWAEDGWASGCGSVARRVCVKHAKYRDNDSWPAATTHSNTYTHIHIHTHTAQNKTETDTTAYQIGRLEFTRNMLSTSI